MKTKVPFYFMDEIIVRSPVYPFQNQLNEAFIYAQLENDFFLEAIYIASPLLYTETIKLKEGVVKSEKEKTKILFSLHKYLTRMQTRSTPFGLFSTCTVGTWANAPSTLTFATNTLARHTRLDMHFLPKMVTYISGLPDCQNHMRYFPNNSIYPVGSELRYMEYTYISGFRHYKLSAITNNPYITAILNAAKDGIDIWGMVQAMLAKNIPEADARKFIEDLISSQVLTSEFEVALTSPDDFTVQIQKHLHTLYQRSGNENILQLSELFNKISARIHTLDEVSTNKIPLYKEIMDQLKKLEPGLDESKTFHIDSYRMNAEVKVNEKVKADLLELFAYLKKINGGRVDTNWKMEAFKQKFLERYEYRAVPLTEALDSDFGIGYPIDKNLSSAGLVNDIPFSQREQDAHLTLNVLEKWLWEILRDPANKSAFTIALDQQPQPTFPADESWDRLPHTLSAMFRILNDEKETLHFEYFFGPSAGCILARFAYGNPEIKSVVEDIARKEEEGFENCLLAEIVHMPDNRISNVIMHPPFRKFEIPFLATPSVEKDNVIGIEDLFIKIENNEIILFSKRLNKRVLPVKTHVHNHYTNTLPLYHFLGDLHNEGVNKSINFSWGSLSQLFVFLPRVTYKNIIVSPAMWRLPQAAFDIQTEDSAALFAQITKLRQQYAIPDRVLYAESDNELLVDFTNAFSVQAWFNTIRKKNGVLLKEFLWMGPCDGQQHIHQYIATLVSEDKKYFVNPLATLETALPLSRQTTQRIFETGSEWLYLKLYCGSTSADLLLTKVIQPLVNHLSAQGLIKKWFFIKYVDSDYHIRLRLHLNNPAETGTVISIINQYINQSRDKFLINKIIYDQYVREIERYGANSVELCESIFYIDSLVALELLKVFQHDKKEQLKPLWAMKLVDDFLTACQFSLKEKTDFVNTTRAGFAQEFGSNKQTVYKINSKYTTYKNTIKEIMQGNAPGKVPYELLRQKSEMVTPLVEELIQLNRENKLEVHAFYLLASLIHMMLNRLITQQERLHEFVIYEFLSKYYTTISHLNRKEEAKQGLEKMEV